MQVGPPEQAGLPPRYRFPLDLLSSEEGLDQLQWVLEQWSEKDCDIEEWWEGVHQLVRAVAEEWCKWRLDMNTGTCGKAPGIVWHQGRWSTLRTAAPLVSHTSSWFVSRIRHGKTGLKRIKSRGCANNYDPLQRERRRSRIAGRGFLI